MQEARYWTSYQDKPNHVQCRLCFHQCVIAPGKEGFCKARGNRDGKLYAITYGKVSSIAIDPIEKKPLYHFHPGKEIYSIGSYGCNLSCSFCQNFHISQETSQTKPLSPEEAAGQAKEFDTVGIAFTYNEPTIWFEYVCDTGALAKEAGLKSVLVTNGMIEPEPLDELLHSIDAANVDIKSMDKSFYNKLCQGLVSPALNTARTIYNAGKHLELTYLIIPDENDSKENFEDFGDWVLNELGSDVPIHLSAYFPRYKLSRQATPIETLYQAKEILDKNLDYVFLGNINAKNVGDTVCAHCDNTIITRYGYSVAFSGMTQDGLCTSCGKKNNIIL